MKSGLESKQLEEPILVTGIHRSGTTWVGKMLAESPRITYVSEPLNRLHRLGVFNARVDHWYTYISENNEGKYLPAYLDIVRDYRYHFIEEIKTIHSIKDFLRMWRDSSRILMGRLLHTRILFKDPFAVLSAPWFAQRLGCKVIIMIRHPAGFVSSLYRLGWNFQLTDLLSQSQLMEKYFEPNRGEILAISKEKDDIIAQASLLWKLIYKVVLDYQDRFPNFYFLRHEDISLDPLNEFEKLFAYVGVPFTERIRKKVVMTSLDKNPKELSTRHVHSVRLDSKANIKAWKHRLTEEEIKRIYALTEEVAIRYYSEEDW